MPRPATAAVLGLALAGLAAAGGCSTSGGLFGGSSAARDRASADVAAAGIGTSAPETGGLAIYFETMLGLVSGDELERAATFNGVRNAANFAPTTTNRLLYALALSVPRHPGTDPEAAVLRLRELIAAGDALTPEERMLAQIQLETANELLILQDASRQIEQHLADAEAARDADYEERLRSLQTRNAELEAELENARTTLDAITNIERSLSEREDSLEDPDG